MDETVELLCRRTEWVRGLAGQLISDQHLAEDVAQEAAVVALKKSERRVSPAAWVATVMRNVARDTGRRAGRQDRLLARVQQETGADEAPSAAEAAAAVEQQRLLAEAVMELPEPFRDVVVLRFYEQLPPREVAAALKIPLATVKSRLHRALDRLRGHLDQRHGGDRAAWLTALAPLVSAPPKPLAPATMFAVHKKALGGVAALLAVAAALFAVRVVDREEDPAVRSAGLMGSTPASGVGEAVGDPNAQGRLPLAAAATSGREGAWITVVDGMTGDALPHAQVAMADRGPAMPWSSRGRFPDWVFQEGRRQAVDGRGRFWLDATVDPVTTAVVGKDATRVGHVVPADLRDLGVLKLWPARTAHVKVRDESGRAMPGAPVSLAARWPGLDRGQPLSIATTDPNGSVSIVWYEQLARGITDVVLTVALGVPGAEDVSDVLVATPAMETEHVLTCPSVGTARVNVVRKGPQRTVPVWVSLGRADDASRANAQLTTADHVEFWPVAVGVELSTLAWLDGTQRLFEAKSVEITRASGHAELDVVVETSVARYTAQLCDRHGAPRQGVELYAQCGMPDEVHGQQRCDTGEDGRFSFELVGRPRVDRVLQLHDMTTRQSIEVALPAAGEQVVDLGPLTIDDRIPLARGSLRYPDGRPVDGAVMLGRPTVQGIEHVGEFVADTDADGHFELQGQMPSDAAGLVLTARSRAGGWVIDPVPWNFGADPYQLVMRQPNRLSGNLLLDHDVDATALNVEIWNESRGPADWQRPWQGVRVERDGSFESVHLASGSYTLAVRLSGRRRQAVIAVAGLRPNAAGEPDPRLVDLDLRGRLHPLEIHARAPDGKRLAGTFFVRCDDDLVQGNVGGAVVVDGSIQSVIVEVDGFFPATLKAFRGTKHVQLEPGLDVQVALSAVPALPVGVLLEVCLEADGAAPIPRFRRRFRPDYGQLRDGRVGLRVPTAGAYRPRLAVVRETPGFLDIVDVEWSTLPSAIVNAGDELAWVVDSGAIQRAVAKLR